MKQLILALSLTLLLVGCVQQEQTPSMSSISESVINQAVDLLKTTYPDADAAMIERGVNSAASFWISADGKDEAFILFCKEHFAATPEQKETLFNTLDHNLEVLFGNYNKISVDLKMPLHVVGNPITDINEAFGAFDPMAHFSDDMFSSKIAFTVLLNFPFYTLDEKNTLGKDWDGLQWAYARMGDVFNARIPAQVTQNIADKLTQADSYISNYNIMMDMLRTEDDEQLFPDDMHLITHWGLRDELKSNYSNADGKGSEKQEMIYQVMKHIVNQTIPSQVISNAQFTWQPSTNRIFQNRVEQEVTVEPDTRYEMLFGIYQAVVAEDPYCPTYPTYLQRSFDKAMEVSADDIEKMFVDYISSPAVEKVAA